MGSPLSREEIESKIASALVEYDEDVRAAWARIRIEPEKWRCSPWGDDAGGFWAVAIVDDRVLWYNDIEEGFNSSPFSKRGTIGEYACNQASFTEVLDDIEHERGQGIWKGLHEHEVPAELVGPGTIVRRQTTYWELRAAAGFQYRVHFRDKIEVRFIGADYPQVAAVSNHPLLVQYESPTRSLYFAGTPIDPHAVAETLGDVIATASDRWRSLGEYSGRVEATLRAGHGLLMDGPESVCIAVAAALEAAGVSTSVLGVAPARPGYRVLLLGRSFVIARAFAFERRTAS